MIVLGLTGSIGMGKSTAAGIFRRLGAAVFDADRCVHDLYEGPVADLLDSAFPGVKQQGRVDRNALAERILRDPKAMAQLESLIHPLVLEKRREFLSRMRDRGARLVVLDLPLLFETGSEKDVDAIAVVSASASIQAARVLARRGMSADKLAAILARQTPDAAKRRSCHFIVQSDCGLMSAERQIKSIMAALSPCE
ncbi:dephospho-CoA kinase [uncultured Rhodoblastus sp.]|uniref:dephospho-CoA kinase n=1 Tax=uncultured Rhodoblastus sp. TaxID=543037 RepID=UPI0025CFDCD2|nr:dephospho-CoA kinase [uncultured Rhodoblastus sp.]